jgi:LPXTG-motif cell wall-anchored protein
MRHTAREMMTGAAAAVAGFVLGAVAGASGASAAPIGTVCVAESYSWVGRASLAPGETFDTGVSVPAEPGAQLAVRAVDYSTDVVGSPVAISVGQRPASSGSDIDGGSIAATNGGQAALMVTSVALNIDRCHQVEQAPPVQGLAVSGPATATAVASGSASPAAPAAPVVPVAPADGLPNTGSTSAGLVWAAAASLAAGSALVAISRRRAVAG